MRDPKPLDVKRAKLIRRIYRWATVNDAWILLSIADYFKYRKTPEDNWEHEVQIKLLNQLKNEDILVDYKLTGTSPLSDRENKSIGTTYSYKLIVNYDMLKSAFISLGSQPKLDNQQPKQTRILDKVTYSRGIISQGSNNYKLPDNKYIKMIELLWPNREISGIDNKITKPPKPLNIDMLGGNIGLSNTDRLVNMIDYFNPTMRNNNINARISRRGGVYLIVRQG